MSTKQDARQNILRDYTSQLTSKALYGAAVTGEKPINSTEVDNLLVSIDKEVTPLLRILPSDTPDLKMTVESSLIINPEHKRNRILAPNIGFGNAYTTGAVTLPAASGGTITVTGGNNLVLTIANDRFIKLGIYLGNDGKLKLKAGTENATLAAAEHPGELPGYYGIGYIIVKTVGAVVQVIKNEDIYQYSDILIGQSGNQDRNIALIGGGTWSNLTTIDHVADATSDSLNAANIIFAQSFKNTILTNITSVKVRLEKVASPNANFVVDICTDNSGQPGAILATSNPIAATAISTKNDYEFTLATPYTSTIGTLYYIRVRTISSVSLDATNYIKIYRSTTDSYIDGAQFNSTDNGGSWSAQTTDLRFNVLGTVRPNVAWSSDAYMQLPGFANDRNTIKSAIYALEANQLLYVDMNRTENVLTNLTPVVVNLTDFVEDNNRFVIAREYNGVVIVGNGSFRLVSGESQTLDASASDQTLKLLGGSSFTEAVSDPTWTTRNSPLRTINATDSVLDAIGNIDDQIDKMFDQLRLEKHATTLDRGLISGVNRTLLDNSEFMMEYHRFMISFTGAQIDFTTGKIYKSDGTTPLGLDFTPFAIPAGQYLWYAVSIDTLGTYTDGKLNMYVKTRPATATNAVKANAVAAKFNGGVRLGQFLVYNDGGTIKVDSIRQVGVTLGSDTNTSGRFCVEDEIDENLIVDNGWTCTSWYAKLTNSAQVTLKSNSQFVSFNTVAEAGGKIVIESGSTWQVVDAGQAESDEYNTVKLLHTDDNYKLKDLDEALCNTTNGAFKVYLPDHPTNGTRIRIKDAHGTCFTNNLSIYNGLGGATIENQSPPMVFNVNRAWAEYVYLAADNNWAVFGPVVTTGPFNGFGLVPIGSLVPVMKNIPGSWQPPATGVIKDGFQLADGAVVNDTGSPLNGSNTPNMIEKFLRGGTVSGLAQGESDNKIKSSHIPQHNHSIGNHTHSINHNHAAVASGSGGVAHTHGAGSFKTNGDHTHSFLHMHSLDIDYDGSHNHTSYLGGGYKNWFAAGSNRKGLTNDTGSGNVTQTSTLAGTHKHTGNTSNQNTSTTSGGGNDTPIDGTSGGASATSHTHSVDLPNFAGTSGSAGAGNTGNWGNATPAEYMPYHLTTVWVIRVK